MLFPLWSEDWARLSSRRRMPRHAARLLPFHRDCRRAPIRLTPSGLNSANPRATKNSLTDSFQSGINAAMKIGLVGYQGSGKSSLFEWLTGVPADPALAHVSQSAMAPVPEPRVDPLCAVYHPKKVTLASLELADTAGLSRSHEGNAAKLGLIREAGALIVVVAAYDPARQSAGRSEPIRRRSAAGRLANRHRPRRTAA